MRIFNGKALLLKLRNPFKVIEAIPKSRKLSAHDIVVNWGLEEAQTLKSLNINVPSPIHRRYGWPGNSKPFSHQKDTASFLTLNKKSFCFNEQGTGKTASAIWASDYLMNEGKVDRVLVICPLSIMDSAWGADLFNFAPHRTVDIAYGTASKKKEDNK